MSNTKGIDNNVGEIWLSRCQANRDEKEKKNKNELIMYEMENETERTK